MSPRKPQCSSQHICKRVCWSFLCTDSIWHGTGSQKSSGNSRRVTCSLSCPVILPQCLSLITAVTEQLLPARPGSTVWEKELCRNIPGIWLETCRDLTATFFVQAWSTHCVGCLHLNLFPLLFFTLCYFKFKLVVTLIPLWWQLCSLPTGSMPLVWMLFTSMICFSRGLYTLNIFSRCVFCHQSYAWIVLYRVLCNWWDFSDCFWAKFRTPYIVEAALSEIWLSPVVMLS